MGKKLSDIGGAPFAVFGIEPRRLAVLALAACLIVAGCSGSGYRPPPGDTSGPVHGESGGGDGGGGGGM